VTNVEQSTTFSWCCFL